MVEINQVDFAKFTGRAGDQARLNVYTARI